MFRKNNSHYQQELFSHYQEMRPNIAKLLENTWAPVFYREVFCKIDEEPFACLYCQDNGRPNFPVNILLALEIIKHINNYTDKQLLEQFYFNYQVLYALGIRNIGQVYIAERTLYEFRERVFNYLVEHPDKEELLFEQFNILVKNFIQVLGLKTDELRIDSTLVSPYIKKAGRLSLAYDVLVQAVKALPEELLTEELKEVLDKEFKTRLLYHSRNRSLDSRLQNILALMGQVIKLTEEHPQLNEDNAVLTLRRFLEEQTFYDENQGRFVPKESSKIPSGSLQSAYDADATFREKAGQKHVGYSLTVTETANDANPVQLITDFVLEPNNQGDAVILKERLPVIKESTDVCRIYADGGYYSQEVVEQAESLGIKMHYTDMTGRKTSEEKLSVSSFQFNERLEVTACPNGIKPISSKYNPKTKSTITHFEKEDCQSCPLQKDCPVKEQKKAMVLRVPKRSLLASSYRQKIKDKSIKYENTRKRAAIEGTNSSMKRSQGLAKLRVRGKIKCFIHVTFKIIGHNFKQLLRGLKALTRGKPEKGLVCPQAA